MTVETYQWFVRNAGKISSAYTIVICDEAHTALGEKTSASDPRVDRPDLHRHDRHGRADRASRDRPVPHPDLALRPRSGGPTRRDRAAAVRADLARRGRAHDRQGAASPRRGRHRVRPGRARQTARPAAVQPRRRQPLPDALQRRARASSTRPACATPTTSRRPSAPRGSRPRASQARPPSASWPRSSRATSAATSTC